MAKFTWDKDQRQHAKAEGTALLGFSADWKAGKATISAPDANQDEVGKLVTFMVHIMTLGFSPREAFEEAWGTGGDAPVVPKENE